ncbi:MAG: hypothetical protein JXA22_09875, partial [Candidatus Thermoplasmatota archaeon]|nr:hypothetical protein [Candidatus Thermoplasmatota archaeon]
MRMMRCPTILIFTSIMVFLTIFCFLAGGDETIERKCVVIVSGREGYTQHELEKASSFREYLLDDCTTYDLIYL